MSKPPTASKPDAVAEAHNRKLELLLEFLQQCESEEQPASCPVCGYNLTALTKPVCPECGQELALTVGAARHPIVWLLAALAPGFFSGIAAFFVLIPIVLRYVFGDGRMSLLLNSVDLFGWCSGVFAIALAMKRHRFLALSLSRQRLAAIVIWVIHIAALALFITLAALFL